jgi:predicted transcriptional regulator
MPRYTESDLQNALDALQAGSSLRKASKDWNIPLSTLYDRVNGSTSRRDANQHNQRLSETQETSLASWVLA